MSLKYCVEENLCVTLAKFYFGLCHDIQHPHSFTAAPAVIDPCNLNPCGPNARCNNGICICLPEYQGDPYVGCRPECVMNTDCAHDRACVRNKCMDPCPGTCGRGALCSVYNHVPICTCSAGMTGNAFVQCSIIEGIINAI